mmetsp:Transcript_52842/g.139080  ORF Transcript_52842/g.139080 Transcript_52842/m.139080 type:complete len:93 (+) Transcript_52842:329-607(+)
MHGRSCRLLVRGHSLVLMFPGLPRFECLGVFSSLGLTLVCVQVFSFSLFAFMSVAAEEQGAPESRWRGKGPPHTMIFSSVYAGRCFCCRWNS